VAPVVVLALGVLSVALLGVTGQIRERQRADFELARALMDLHIRALAANLALEEFITGDPDVDLERLWGGLDLAVEHADAIRRRIEVERDWLFPAAGNAELKSRMERIAGLLSDFRTRLRQRYAHHAGPQRSETDVHDALGDAILEQFQGQAQAAEALTRERTLLDDARANRLVLGIVIAWSTVVAVATTGLWTREWHRRRAQHAMAEAMERLATQTDELERHRSRLTELVGERTSELTRANEQLRALAGHLQSAREDERTRIAREIHDELGQILTGLKFDLCWLAARLPHDASLRARAWAAASWLVKIRSTPDFTRASAAAGIASSLPSVKRMSKVTSRPSWMPSSLSPALRPSTVGWLAA
jgi:signal transduction histidine kinase